jgi:O-antigen/teichoic acid export membrane protein
MANEKEHSDLTNKSLLASNTFIYAGSKIIPLLLGFFLIPRLIEGLGQEAFGYLTIVWLLINYLGLLDFGIGSSLVKYLAEYANEVDKKEFSQIAWNGFYTIVTFSSIVSIILYLFNYLFLDSYFNSGDQLYRLLSETLLYLTFTVPLIISASVFRSILIVKQSFKVLSAVQATNSVLNYLLPFVLLLIGFRELIDIVLILIIVKVFVTAILLQTVLKSNFITISPLSLNTQIIKKLLSFGGWVTISNILGPFIAQLDRYFVGVHVNPKLVAYYTTPVEVLGKVAIIPHSISTVIYPALSSIGSLTNKGKALIIEATRIKMVFLFITLSLISFYSFELLSLWINSDFAQESYYLTIIFCCTMYVRNMAAIPVTVLNSQSKPHYAAFLHIVEIALYFTLLNWVSGFESLLYFAIAQLSITIFDTLFLYIFCYKELRMGLVGICKQLIYLFLPTGIIIIPLISLGTLINSLIWILCNLVLISWFLRTQGGKDILSLIKKNLSILK